MRYFVRLLAIAICVTLVVSVVPDPGPVQSTAMPQPNIVMILADDLDQMFNTIDTMPNLQALLIAQGMTFSHSMVPVPVCCPAHASLLTGQLVHNHRVYANVPPIGGFAAAYANGLENATVATALHSAGYRTALLGKYLNGYPNADAPTYIPPGWDEWFVPISDNAYGSYDYTVNDNGTLTHLRQHGAGLYHRCAGVAGGGMDLDNVESVAHRAAVCVGVGLCPACAGQPGSPPPIHVS